MSTHLALAIGLALVILGILVIAAFTTGAGEDWAAWWAQRRQSSSRSSSRGRGEQCG